MSGARPPGWARWVLSVLLPRGVRRWALTDLDERYAKLAGERGQRHARRWFRRQVWSSVVTLARPNRRSPRQSNRDGPMTASSVTGLRHDLIFALRLLARYRGMAALTIMTLALGIGANAALFSVVNHVLLRPLPYANADELVMLWHESGRSQTTWISLPEYLDYREQLESMASLAAFDILDANLTGGGEPERVTLATVTASTFDVLGIQPVLGRGFAPEDDNMGAEPVAIVTAELFRRRYGEDRSVLGTRLLLDDVPFTIVGVLPAAVRLPLEYGSAETAALWIPLRIDPQNVPGRNDRSWHAMGRLRTGFAVAGARAELRTLHDGWHADGTLPESLTGPGLIPIPEFVLGDTRPLLVIVFAATGFVLLIACANVANLLLARGEVRRREIGVRTALGASRGRILRQWLTESVVVSFAGGVLGLGLAVVGTEALIRWGPAEIPRLADVAVDLSVAGFTAIVTAATGLVFGLLPAFQATQVDPHSVLQEGGRGTSEGAAARRVRGALVVVELALAVTLAVGSVLTVRSFAKLRGVDLGFQSSSVTTARLDLPRARYADPGAVVRFFEDVVRGVALAPGVEAVGAARVLPLDRTIGDWSITIDGYDVAPGENPNGDFQVVVPGYFEAMRIPVVAGRALEETDRADGRIVAVVSETMADRYWPEGNAIGQRFRLGGPQSPWHEIVGVVRDVRHNGIIGPPHATMYITMSQWAAATRYAPRGMTLVVRSAPGVDAVLLARRAIGARDPDLPVAQVQPLEAVVARASATTRFAMVVLNLFGGIAVLLAAIGVYGVISYAVSRRQHEMGVRLAMGATRSQVMRHVLAQTGRLLAVGLIGGIVLAATATRLLSTLLYDVSPWDLPSFVGVAALLLVVGLVAAYLPARRAASVDPVSACRSS